MFTDGFDPEPRSPVGTVPPARDARRVAAGSGPRTPKAATLRRGSIASGRSDRRACGRIQVEAIRIEGSLPRTAPGADPDGDGLWQDAHRGERLLPAGASARMHDAILFLVDRANLGRQTLKEFQAFATPDDGRKFTELYNVQHLTLEQDRPRRAGRASSTIQRALLDPARRGRARPKSSTSSRRYEIEPEPCRSRSPTTRRSRSRPSTSSSSTSATARSTGVWRQVLEYFDAFTIGLTATPSKQTFGFFNQNLVMEYGHEQAVADERQRRLRRLPDPHRDQRARLDDRGRARHRVPRPRDPPRPRWEKLDEDVDLRREGSSTATVVSSDQIRTVHPRRSGTRALHARSSPGAPRSRRR